MSWLGTSASYLTVRSNGPVPPHAAASSVTAMRSERAMRRRRAVVARPPVDEHRRPIRPTRVVRISRGAREVFGDQPFDTAGLHGTDHGQRGHQESDQQRGGGARPDQARGRPCAGARSHQLGRDQRRGPPRDEPQMEPVPLVESDGRIAREKQHADGQRQAQSQGRGDMRRPRRRASAAPPAGRAAT